MSATSDLANALRFLSIDAVEQARSGHPGMPMGMATIAEVLWREFLRHNPANPKWPNRDRFVLSNGHGSMLLYALLHLSGYALSLEQVKQFRQLHSQTPGHPEVGETAGVETTTGPLGQGLANAVGFALAERSMAAEFNQADCPIINHYTYAFAGDGCLMEGVSHEACSLAGTLGLGKLIVFWDNNGISIDGQVTDWFADDVPARFQAYGWHVIPDVDGHERTAVQTAIAAAQAEQHKPTLIACRTVIGYGSPRHAGSEKSHGAALGADEVAATRQALQWPHAPFEIPADVYSRWDQRPRGAQLQMDWQARYEHYRTRYPALAAELERRLQAKLPTQWAQQCNSWLAEIQAQSQNLASRKASQNCLHKLGKLLPEMVGGSADLTGSNLTLHQSSRPINRQQAKGNYLYYGVREFGMSAIMNGLALYGGLIPYGGTFLVFADYARNAMRMSALMKQRVIYVLTHDSIGLGEDGPTHQPIEHLNMLRETPNFTVWRPCDEAETFVAWQLAIENQQGPTSLALSRQSLPAQPRSSEQLAAIYCGGYVLYESAAENDIILIATGSEVALARTACTAIEQQGARIRLVSMPSPSVFLQQPQSYRDAVLPAGQKRRLAIEAGASGYWYRFVGLDGAVIGIDRFGASAPGDKVYEEVGLTVEQIVAKMTQMMKQ